MQPITIGGFDYTQDEKGQWIYKAKKNTPLSSVKKDAPRYREQPQYELNKTIEENSKSHFNKLINQTALELIKSIKENLK